MPVTDPYQHVVPAATGEQPERAAFDRLSASLRTIKTVASTAARAALIADMTAAGSPPSAANRVMVWRQDAPANAQLEVTTDGTTWDPIEHGDTGWVTVARAGSWGDSGGTLPACQVRRVGRTVMWRGGGQATLALETDTAMTAAAPTWARPTVAEHTRVMMGTLGGQLVRGWVTTGGVVTVRTNAAGGQTVYLPALRYTID